MTAPEPCGWLPAAIRLRDAPVVIAALSRVPDGETDAQQSERLDRLADARRAHWLLALWWRERIDELLSGLPQGGSCGEGDERPEAKEDHP